MASDSPESLLGIASGLLDEASARFITGVGAPSAVTKGNNDFATELDLELERTLSAGLLESTGIPVHGEEFGGPELTSGRVWVIDPIDGTYNYSAGLPLTGMLLALVEDGKPVVGLTWLPLLSERFAVAKGGPMLRNGEPVPQLAPARLADSMIAFGAFNVASRGRIPGRFRFDVLGELSRLSSRVRMHGSTGIDLAYTAAGVLGGSIVFGYHAWDNAAGALMVEAAGGVVTDLAGEPWTIESGSVLAAAPGVHEELLEMIASVDERERNGEVSA
ncbi:inositol monophosphatase family protein [Aldersonia kunmingensis]|uniref:inositol monophosphatase family protein n=1 Tax=Aldersonia kunmingensis TaxID=408066 RepID=UPI0008316F2A|nr:inositol monophosphatase family protein [Aldersonia kunmingensis]